MSKSIFTRFDFNATLSGYFIADVLKGLQVEGRYNYQIYRQDVHKWGSSSGVRWDYVKDEVREEASLNRATIYNYALNLSSLPRRSR